MELILKHLGAIETAAMLICAIILLAGILGYFVLARPKLSSA